MMRCPPPARCSTRGHPRLYRRPHMVRSVAPGSVNPRQPPVAGAHGFARTALCFFRRPISRQGGDGFPETCVWEGLPKIFALRANHPPSFPFLSFPFSPCSFFPETSPKSPFPASLRPSWHNQCLPCLPCLPATDWHRQCYKTAELIAEYLKIDKSSYEVVFQSRLGKSEWLRPYLSERLKELPQEGIKNIQIFLIICYFGKN